MTKDKEELKFIFPNAMAKMMKNVDMRTQLESSLISMSLILVAMTLMVIYLVMFGEGSGYYKFLIVFNLCCGFLFLSSFLVTTYHQYLSYMTTMGIDPSKHKEEIKKRGNIFKRISLAIKDKKAQKNKVLSIVKDSEDMNKRIDVQRDIDMAVLNKEAQQLKNEETIKTNNVKRR